MGARPRPAGASRVILALAAACLAPGPGPVSSSPGPPTRITRDGLDKQRPCWSPDGKVLLFARHEAGGTQIRQYLLTPGALEEPRRLTARSTPEYDGVFSPDGRRVLF